MACSAVAGTGGKSRASASAARIRVSDFVMVMAQSYAASVVDTFRPRLRAVKPHWPYCQVRANGTWPYRGDWRGAVVGLSLDLFSDLTTQQAEAPHGYETEPQGVGACTQSR